MAYIRSGTGGGNNCVPFIKGIKGTRGQNVSFTISAKKNDILFVESGWSSGYEPIISGSVQALTEWHTIYSVGKQRVYKVTADGDITITNKTTYGAHALVISKNGEEISCNTITCSVNSTVTVSDVKENELFMTHTYGTNYTSLKPGTDNKTMSIIDSYNNSTSAVSMVGYASAVRAIGDYDSAELLSGYYVTEIIRFS